MPSPTIGACIKNNYGDLLPYTVRGTMQQCEEWAATYWNQPSSFGGTIWDRLKEIGTKVVQVEIKEI